ncbi:MAG: hypothetical protein J6Y07_01035 [Alphaproteobacteria bacterium]|nr:hypothetical protein [Alphaproteobacteria bacterium]
MIKKFLLCIFSLVLSSQAPATDHPQNPPVSPAPIAPRISIFSTTTDWAALTGLPLKQYVGKFTWKNSDVERGIVLYYLDAFPCYGEADSVRIWLGPNKQSSGILRLVCVHAPNEISFTWRYATRDADQAQSTGLLKCPVTGDYELNIDFSKCVRGPEWKDYK